MSNIGTYLRLMVNGDKELKVQAIRITDTAATITSTLTSEQTRRKLLVYNASNYQSGEIFIGNSDVTSENGFPVPKGSIVEVPVHPDLDPYFVTVSGEIGDLRVLEIA